MLKTRMQSRLPFSNQPLSLVACVLVLLTAGPNAQSEQPLADKDKAERTERVTESAPLKQTVDAFPEGMQRFNGMVVGRLVSKDVEKGQLVLHVDRVPRVWRNSKAESPKSVIGKNIQIDGVFGKWLDVVLVTKRGETIELEARHDGGDKLTFPGELLRKVAPVKPGDYPELPEKFRGFQGAVGGRVRSKDPQTMELILEVERVTEVGEKNRAQTPRSIEGRPLMVAGFWQRREDFARLKAGDAIECSLKHIQTQSDHLTVVGAPRKFASGKGKDSEPEKDELQKDEPQKPQTDRDDR